MGNRTNHIILMHLENIYLQHKNKFAVHQIINIIYTLVAKETANNILIKDFNKYLSSYENKQNLTEMLTYQICVILLRNAEFTQNNINTYFKLYKGFMDKNQAKPKQIKYLKTEIGRKLKSKSTWKITPSLLENDDSEIDTKQYLINFLKDINKKYKNLD
jgi:hypothetical protein